jgi:hypothetical protein
MDTKEPGEVKNKGGRPPKNKEPGEETPQARIQSTKELLEGGVQVTIAIPLAPGEKKGAKDSVSINGYRREFEKGVQVSLPKLMADLVLAHYNIGLGRGVGDEFKMDGDNKGKDLGDISS